MGDFFGKMVLFFTVAFFVVLAGVVGISIGCEEQFKRYCNHKEMQYKSIDKKEYCIDITNDKLHHIKWSVSK